MLKKRTRPVSTTTTTKQSQMSDTYLGSCNTKPIEFAGMSPTSILDAKSFAAAKIPRKPSSQVPVGPSGIADALKEPSVPESRTVLFGSQLRIQIPSVAVGVADSPQSPIEFGIKNKSSQLALLSPAARRAPSPSGPTSRSLSASEMEMSDDYTCVIAHGPNPKTTHIFDNCIIESCCGRDAFAPADRADFFMFCHACKKSLGQGKDVSIYRGEQAFCSHECRYEEIFVDEGTDAPSPEQTAVL